MTLTPDRNHLKLIANQGLHLLVIRSDNNETRCCGTEKIDSLEHLDYLVGLAAIQIVKENYEPLRFQRLHNIFQIAGELLSDIRFADK